MLNDALTTFSDGQEVTVTAKGSKVVDLGAAGDAIPNENFLHVIAKEAGAAAGAATLKISLETSASQTNGVLDSPVVLAESRDVPVADIVQGAELWKLRVPAGCKQYLGIGYTVTTGPLTAGSFDALINRDA